MKKTVVFLLILSVLFGMLTTKSYQYLNDLIRA